MSKFVIDASAWVEYFDGTKIGESVKDVVENKQNKIVTNVITVVELASFFTKKNKDFQEAKKILASLSSFSKINFEFAEEVGKLYPGLRKQKPKIGLADVFVLVTAQRLKGTLVTKDTDLKGFKETYFLA